MSEKIDNIKKKFGYLEKKINDQIMENERHIQDQRHLLDRIFVYRRQNEENLQKILSGLAMFMKQFSNMERPKFTQMIRVPAIQNNAFNPNIMNSNRVEMPWRSGLSSKQNYALSMLETLKSATENSTNSKNPIGETLIKDKFQKVIELSQAGSGNENNRNFKIETNTEQVDHQKHDFGSNYTNTESKELANITEEKATPPSPIADANQSNVAIKDECVSVNTEEANKSIYEALPLLSTVDQNLLKIENIPNPQLEKIETGKPPNKTTRMKILEIEADKPLNGPVKLAQNVVSLYNKEDAQTQIFNNFFQGGHSQIDRPTLVDFENDRNQKGFEREMNPDHIALAKGSNMQSFFMENLNKFLKQKNVQIDEKEFMQWIFGVLLKLYQSCTSFVYMIQ